MGNLDPRESIFIKVEIKSFSITRLKRVIDGTPDQLPTALKSKVSRLRDWNCASIAWPKNNQCCWNQKVSRLRDWNWIRVGRSERHHRVEIKSFSITRLKTAWFANVSEAQIGLKSKVSRLRDWKHEKRDWLRGMSVKGWNQKFLDYEIETWWNTDFVDFILNELKSKVFLDYEIETDDGLQPQHQILSLKSKVSRLRDWNICPNARSCQRVPECWNQKFLDYEIETWLWVDWDACIPDNVEIKSFLDYEIENLARFVRASIPKKRLKSKVFSITRLKLSNRNFGRLARLKLKSKSFLDYEIENLLMVV